MLTLWGVFTGSSEELGRRLKPVDDDLRSSVMHFAGGDGSVSEPEAAGGTSMFQCRKGNKVTRSFLKSFTKLVFLYY